jgi:hypothetical protein
LTFGIDDLVCLPFRKGPMDKPKNKPEKIPSFSATCRAEAIAGTKQYLRCLVDLNVPCWYRLAPITHGPFCAHPRHSEIVAQTRRQ